MAYMVNGPPDQSSAPVGLVGKGAHEEESEYTGHLFTRSIQKEAYDIRYSKNSSRNTMLADATALSTVEPSPGRACTVVGQVVSHHSKWAHPDSTLDLGCPLF